MAGKFTGKRNAVRNNSGLPVHQSGPGLGRANNSTNSQSKAGGLFDISQPKTGRGLGQSPRGGEAAPSSSLDKIQTNRNNGIPENLSALGRKRYCGVWTVAGSSADGTRAVFHRVNCKTWDCRFCGPRKAKLYKRAIRELAEREQLNRFVTLTLDPKKIEGDPVRYLRQVFNKFRTYLKRKHGVSIKYIAVLEFHKSGVPHLHLLVDRFLPQAWISQSWSALGGGRIVDIKFVDIQRISRYLSKYLTKELLLSAPKRSRRVTTARSLHLLEKKKNEIPWVLLKTTIFHLYSRFYLVAFDLELDEEGVLQSFSYAKEIA